MNKENEVKYFETLLTSLTDSKVELVEVKSKREYKPKIPSARYNEDKGEYNYKPLDPNYFNDYYKKCNLKIECPRCRRLTPKLQLSRHVKSM
jgi:hypothetical protein